MKIQHLQLRWDDIPKTGEVELVPVEKSYLNIIYIEWAIFYGVLMTVCVVLFFFINAIQTIFWMIFLPVIVMVAAILSFWLAKKSFAFKSYAVRERDVMARNGWLFQELQVVPIDKIQHCVVKTGPLEKKYQLASLKLFTAGKDADITLSGLQAVQAEQLKEWIVSKQRNNAS